METMRQEVIACTLRMTENILANLENFHDFSILKTITKLFKAIESIL